VGKDGKTGEMKKLRGNGRTPRKTTHTVYPQNPHGTIRKSKRRPYAPEANALPLSPRGAPRAAETIWSRHSINSVPFQSSRIKGRDVEIAY